VCGLYRAQGDNERMFLGLASKPRSTVSLSSASKPVATVSPGLASKPVSTILVVWPQNHSLGFSYLGLKTDSSGLVIWPTKSLRRFLSLGLKTKWEEVCQFTPQNRWKDEDDAGYASRSSGLLHLEVSRLGLPSLASRLAEAQRRWCMWHQRGCHEEMKSKTNRSMRRAATDSSTPTLSFSLY
jgi:hypothetical protein